MQKISTPDLSDLNPDVPFVGLQFNSYGARDFLYGPIKTVHAPNDNSYVKKIQLENSHLHSWVWHDYERILSQIKYLLQT